MLSPIGYSGTALESGKGSRCGKNPFAESSTKPWMSDCDHHHVSPCIVLRGTPPVAVVASVVGGTAVDVAAGQSTNLAITWKSHRETQGIMVAVFLLFPVLRGGENGSVISDDAALPDDLA
jgi:hypothetical protein